MSSRQPVMSRLAWLVLAVSVAATAGILVVGYARNHHGVQATRHVPATATRAGVEVKTVVSVTESRAFFDVVADVTVLNSSAAPVYYVGIPCYAPARVQLVSTLTPPPGPPYSRAATALRAHVMDERRSRDESLSFTQQSKDSSVACDEAGPPVLPPHQPIAYRMTTPLGPANQPFVDALTTDVVTTLQIGSLPASVHSGLPPPMQVVDTVEARTPLSALTDITRPSNADYPMVSKHFDVLMRDPRISSWVDAQDPSQWRAARLMDPYPKVGAWRLEAFNHAWAVPLVVTGTDTAITSVRIPDEPWSPAPSTDAVLPGGAVSTDKLALLYHDLSVGDLVVPSGRVMVGDIVASDGMLTFDYGLKPGGRYPIHIVTARPRYLGDDYQSVAWEELVLSSSPVSRWKPAIPVGHSASELKSGDLFSWGTDGGEGGFASPEAMKFMDATLSDPEFGLYGAIGEREEANDWLWAMLTVDRASGANVFASSTGGDGGFPVLLGVDAQDHPAILLSDFGNLHVKFSGIE